MLITQNTMEEKYYKIWLSLLPDFGVQKYFNLINTFKTHKNIFYSNKTDLLNVKGIGEKTVNEILNIDNKRLAYKHLDYIEKNNIDIISIQDSEYPNLLRKIYSAPIFIYIKGNKNCLKGNNLSIVGCRDCSEYGKEIAQKFSYFLSKENINIVSGLARGIDSYAHLGAIYAKKTTIAVLGNGVDTIYPKENLFISEKILQNGGAIISEYPIGTGPSRLNFPARNRIISGLSKAIFIVEAKVKSGTLITADFALEQGRDIFVLPRKYYFKKFRGN